MVLLSDLFQKQIKLAEGIGGIRFRVAGILAPPAGLDAAEALGEPGQAPFGVETLQGLQQHRHADRFGPQGAAQISLGAAVVAQPVLEEGLQILQLIGAQIAAQRCHQRPGGTSDPVCGVPGPGCRA